MRSEQVILTMQTNLSGESSVKHDPDDLIEDYTVYNTIDYVKNYVEKYTISKLEIVEDEDEKRLIIVAKNEQTPKSEVSEDVVTEDEVLCDVIEVLGTEDIEPEYLDENTFETFLPNQDYFQEQLGSELDEQIVSEDNEIYEEYDDIICGSSSQHSASESTLDSNTTYNPRRPRKPEEWACNKRKTLRNSGKTYLNSKGKVVQAKQMQESCGESCRNRCINKVSEEDRQRTFDNFWALGDLVKQRQFLYNHITSIEPKRRRAQNSNRSVTLQFHLEALKNDGTYSFVQVCKKMFKNTLVVSSQVIQCVMKKYVWEGFVDTRGKFERQMNPGQKFAAEHVKKFPFFYIEQTMTKVQCYQMYLEECAEQGIEPVKEGNYRDIFDKQNQGSFLKKEKIICETCHRYYNATDEQRLLLKAEHDKHISLGINKKCRDRALGRIRHKRAQERKKANLKRIVSE